MVDRSKTYKVVLLGDGGVGKTSLRKRFLGEGFKTNYAMTIGADFAVKKVIVDDNECRVQIWDLSGQKAFHEVRKLYYKNSSGLVLTFDITIPHSFENLPNWIEEYREVGDRLTAPIVILGNKTDLLPDEELKGFFGIAKSYANELSEFLNAKVEFFFTSAKTGKNVDEAFTHLIKLIIDERI